MRAEWKRTRKVAIWALVTVCDGEKVVAEVPVVMRRADMQLMLAAWVEPAATSVNDKAPEAGHSWPALVHIRAMNVAIWALVTVWDGEKVVAEVPVVTPSADMQSIPVAWVEPAARSVKYTTPEDGHSWPAASQVRAMNVAN